MACGSLLREKKSWIQNYNRGQNPLTSCNLVILIYANRFVLSNLQNQNIYSQSYKNYSTLHFQRSLPKPIFLKETMIKSLYTAMFWLYTWDYDMAQCSAFVMLTRAGSRSLRQKQDRKTALILKRIKKIIKPL